MGAHVRHSGLEREVEQHRSGDGEVRRPDQHEEEENEEE